MLDRIPFSSSRWTRLPPFRFECRQTRFAEPCRLLLLLLAQGLLGRAFPFPLGFLARTFGFLARTFGFRFLLALPLGSSRKIGIHRRNQLFPRLIRC